MRCTLGSMAALVAAILIGSALWPEIPAVNAPPRAVAQQNAPGTDVDPKPRDIRGKPATARTQSPAESKQVAEIEAKLDTRIEVEFKETPLTDALEFIADRIKVDILINEASLIEEGLELDEPINLSLKYTTVSARMALELVLEKISLAYRIRDGLIYVETEISNEDELEVQVYNCHDLLQSASESVSRFAGADQEKAGEALIDVIMSATSGPWEDTEGTGGTVEEFEGLLIVRQTQPVHREIKQILEMMRAAQKELPRERKATGPRNKPLVPGRSGFGTKPSRNDSASGFKRRTPAQQPRKTVDPFAPSKRSKKPASTGTPGQQKNR